MSEEIDECWGYLADDLKDLRLGGSSEWDEQRVMEACVEGAEDATFRSIVQQLVQELVGRTLDTRQKLGFYKSINLAMASAKVETYLELKLNNNTEDRKYLMEYLVGEVMANRMLETKLLQSSGEEVRLYYSEDKEKNMCSHMKAMCNTFGFTTATIGTAILKKAELALPALIEKISPEMLLPIVGQDEYSPEEQELLQAVATLQRSAYSRRRGLLLKRTEGTFQSFQWSDKPGVDLFKLKNKSDAMLAGLSTKPSVSLAMLHTVTPLNLYMVTCTGMSDLDRKPLLTGPHKTFKVGKVPDRDGRINTYNAEDRIEQDVIRANLRMRGEKGGGFQKKQDWVCPNCSADVFGSKDKCFRCGTTRDGKKPSDWLCNKCNAVVFATKSNCFKCGAPKGNSPDVASTQQGQKGYRGGPDRNRMQGKGGGKGRGGSKGYGAANRDTDYGSVREGGYKGYTGYSGR